jgi:prepilin-type N-terminal cleavage/methylation domain-containing protein
MERNMRKSGFSAVEVIVVLVIVGIIVALGVVGYNRWKQTQTKSSSTNTSQQSTADAPEIKKTSDLDKATTVLDQSNLDDASASDLETQSSTF